MKILLIQPPLNPDIVGAGTLYLNEPLALETIAAGVLHHDVHILDMRIKDDLKSELNSFNPDIAGITCYTQEVRKVKTLLNEIKSFNRNILTVVGGHHVTLFPEDFKESFTDVAVIGDGYESFMEIADAFKEKKDISSIKGIALNDEDNFAFTGPRPEGDIDKTPIAARHLTKQYRDKYFRASWRPVVSLMTSRGCPYRCNFCSVWKRENGKYRVLSPGRVIKELESFEEKYVSICDDNFFHNTSRAEEICELIKKHGIKKEYKIIGRSDSVVRCPEIIKKWRDIGLEQMFLGLESYKDSTMKSLNKACTVEINNKAIEILQSNGVTVVGQFMVDPDFVKEDFDALADYVIKMKLKQPLFSVLTPLPGTDLYEERKGELLTNNYDMYDLVHSVLPTKLPRKEFYRHYADLYKKCYESEKNEKKGITGAMINILYQKLLNAYVLN